VIITGYNAERLQLSADGIRKEVPTANIRTLVLDLSSLAAVRKAAEEVNAYSEPLHVLPSLHFKSFSMVTLHRFSFTMPLTLVASTP